MELFLKGKKMKKKKSKKVSAYTVRLPEALKKKLDEISKAHGISKQFLMTKALELHLE